MSDTTNALLEGICRDIHDHVISGKLRARYGIRWQDTLRALAAERDALKAENKKLAGMLEDAARAIDKLPPGEWEVWTSCSYRRITARDGPDGGILHAHTHISDGHPDLSWNERQCQALCDLVNGLRAALQEKTSD